MAALTARLAVSGVSRTAPVASRHGTHGISFAVLTNEVRRRCDYWSGSPAVCARLLQRARSISFSRTPSRAHAVAASADESPEAVGFTPGAAYGVGTVVKVQKDLVAVAGLSSGNFPEGIRMAFAGGEVGTLIWHQDPISFVLVHGVGSTPAAGEEVLGLGGDGKDKVFAMVPSGVGVRGRVFDPFGSPLDGKGPVEGGAPSPWFQDPVPVSSRKKIDRNIHTGIRAVDVGVPLGAGQSACVLGQAGSGHLEFASDLVASQVLADRTVIIWAASRPGSEIAALLASRSVLPPAAVVAAPAGAGPGMRMAAILAALGVGEGLRGRGMDAVVILDDLTTMMEAWSSMTTLSPVWAGQQGAVSDSDPDQKMSVDGMWVDVEDAERRRFFSSFLQRTASLTTEAGGGTLTLICLVPTAVPGARPNATTKAEVDAKYPSLSEGQRAKLLAAFQAKAAEAAGAVDEGVPLGVANGVAEECVSLADGHIVIKKQEGGGYVVNGTRSMSRIGLAAANPHVAALTVKMGLNIRQSVDEDEFGIRAEADADFARVQAFLTQPPGSPVPLEDLVVGMTALERGLCSHVPPPEARAYVASLVAAVRRENGELVEGIAAGAGRVDDAAALTAALEAAAASVAGG